MAGPPGHESGSIGPDDALRLHPSAAVSTLMPVPMPAAAGLLPGPPHPDGRPSLGQCVVLAVLIHILVVLVFGSAPGGSARPGEGVWGTLNIRLTGSDATGRNEATVAADAHSGPAGTATRQRWGGAVRSPDLAEPEQHTPGAARQGVWQPQPSDAATEDETRRPTLGPATPAQAVPIDPAPAGRLRAPMPAAAPAAVAAPAAAPTARPALVPEPPTDRLPPGSAAQQTSPGANLPVPALDMPAAAPAAVDAPAPTPGPPTPARVAPQQVNPVAIPLPSAPPMPASSVDNLPLPTLPQPAATPNPPTPVAAVPVPAPPPAAPPAAAPPSPPTPPAPAARAAAPAAPVVAPTSAPPTTALPAAEAPTAAPATAPADAAVPAPTPAAAPATPAAAGRSLPTPPGAGAPDAGSRVGHDVATAPSQPPSAPRLNLDLVRPRGGPISAQGSRGLLPMMPVPPDTRGKLADDLKNAAKPDCRTAYAGMGVLAAVPLAADALRDKGCRW